MKKKYCTAIVLAAGQGKRMGSSIHKQFLELKGHPILYYSLQAFQDSPLVERMILVTGETEISYVKEEIVEKYQFDKVTDVIAGGAERYASVWNGLQTLERKLTEEEKDGFVFIHDGVRPFIHEEILRRAYDAVEEHHACVVGMPSKDTVKIADAEGFVRTTPARSLVWNIQTPQVFDFRLAHQAYAELEKSGRTDATDDAMIVEAFTDTKVKLVEGSYENIKITTPEDLEIAETFLRRR
ncbi:2-C-methyl-D-erythritol 4-phosphate cytidylyltransferase [Anaerosacchariphilus sp. NSJ-68]|uniref:2-C-methyl-D-erythritol 4-phosphate cytidylyltransferase n=2 Tax=Lachnospiraceae TaxID=186803 RepID=A0A923L9G9_9FIRM|nr:MULTISPECIES: 2-C-methyl-D-erythritol 4-phosphate cytidylyltransferase [Lachnospiraceae]MBC5658183.1 2-C-methyl-D-erythritol 4-phosphate cytidylyltransferase [Anaerosacchariphilus hominis]MBC5698611.1 2-C-methyl-D-erythritol 4-phosphate cytidylyltransferase [Roseburia difficilis]